MAENSFIKTIITKQSIVWYGVSDNSHAISWSTYLSIKNMCWDTQSPTCFVAILFHESHSRCLTDWYFFQYDSNNLIFMND